MSNTRALVCKNMLPPFNEKFIKNCPHLILTTQINLSNYQGQLTKNQPQIPSIDAFHLKSLEYPYNKIGMVLHLWEPKGTFLTKFYKTGYDLWIKSSWLSTSNDPLITELVEIMDCENILQAGIELGVYFDHISGLCSNFDLGLWPSEAFYWPYYITDINGLVQ